MRKNFKDVGFYPQPVLIIGTYDADGVPDAMNVGWGGLVGGRKRIMWVWSPATPPRTRLPGQGSPRCGVLSWTRPCLRSSP